MDPAEIARAVAREMERLVDWQRRRVARKAQELLPGCTWEDMMNPDGVPQLRGDPLFNYEDGQLAGLLSAQTALQACVVGPVLRGEPPGRPSLDLRDP
ncbi:MAG TPA: hypothetical protein VEI02_13095 [Planctomycetota bacterium]|nr:hypothetical protein [Planctomycetota bacterium]